MFQFVLSPYFLSRNRIWAPGVVQWVARKPSQLNNEDAIHIWLSDDMLCDINPAGSHACPYRWQLDKNQTYHGHFSFSEEPTGLYIQTPGLMTAVSSGLKLTKNHKEQFCNLKSVPYTLLLTCSHQSAIPFPRQPMSYVLGVDPGNPF